jgi:thioredoxin-like negative regulator of GroEL
MHKIAQIWLLVLASWCGTAVCWGEDLLIFTAAWCRPCQQFKRDLAKEPEMLIGHNVVVIDINEEPEAAQAHGVKTVPTFLLFLPGGELKVKTGYNGSANLKAWVGN